MVGIEGKFYPMVRVRKSRVQLLKLFVFISVMGVIGACSPLRDSDLAIIKTHEKYPLKIAVITTAIEDYRFTPDMKRTTNKSYYYPRIQIKPACEDFFQLLFHEVDFVSDRIPENETYDLIVRLSSLSIEDFSKKARKAVQLTLNMHVDFVSKNNRNIFDTALDSSGTSEWGGTKKVGGIVIKYDASNSIKESLNYTSAISDAVRGVFRQLGQELIRHPNPLDKYVVYLAVVKKGELEKRRRLLGSGHANYLDIFMNLLKNTAIWPLYCTF